VTSAAPTVVALETTSAWILILATSLITLPLVIALRRIIGRPGGLASGILLSLPLALPLVVAIAFHKAVLPEVAVLRPVLPSLLDGAGKDVFDMFWFSSEPNGILVPYALWGSPGPWLVMFGLGVTSFMLVRRVLGTLALGRIVRRSTPIEQTEFAWVVSVAERVAQSADMAQVPTIVVPPPGVSGAFVTMGRPPNILMSRDLLESLSADEVEGVLAHEIAHLEARDIPVAMAGGIMRDLVAWNPLAHIALRHLLRDREYEADRRAAILTRKPLAVASSLLKVYELSRRSGRLTPQTAIPFTRRRGRVVPRVQQLIALADGSLPARRTGYAPYIAAACLVAVVSVQVGMQIGGQTNGAFAIVVGAPEINDVPVWTSETDVSREKGKLRAEKAGRSRKVKNVAERRPYDREFDTGMGLKSQDVKIWASRVTKLARSRGIPSAAVRAELRHGWQAVPVISSTGTSVGIYRMEDLPPDLFTFTRGPTR
jgi:Zn-dependent protease with chaperone function